MSLRVCSAGSILSWCGTAVPVSSTREKTFASADDVAQEVCLAVLTAQPNYRAQGWPVLELVYGIASHKMADAHRSAARNRTEPVPEISDTQYLTSCASPSGWPRSLTHDRITSRERPRRHTVADQTDLATMGAS